MADSDVVCIFMWLRRKSPDSCTSRSAPLYPYCTIHCVPLFPLICRSPKQNHARLRSSKKTSEHTLRCTVGSTVSLFFFLLPLSSRHFALLTVGPASGKCSTGR